MSLIKTGAEIRAQLDETNAAINLLQEELGDELNAARKRGDKPSGFPWAAFEGFVGTWVSYYATASTSAAMLNSGGTYDVAVEYLVDCHKWRKRAVKDGALPASKADDPYSEPPKDPTGMGDLLKGGMVIAGLYLIARILGKT